MQINPESWSTAFCCISIPLSPFPISSLVNRPTGPRSGKVLESLSQGFRPTGVVAAENLQNAQTEVLFIGEIFAIKQEQGN